MSIIYYIKNINSLIQGLVGIYAIEYNDEIIYVGKSTNISNRLKVHYRSNVKSILSSILKEEGKCNRCKQLAMYLFFQKIKEEGKDNEIKFIILEQCNQEELNEKEKSWIEHYKPKFNYVGVDVPYILTDRSCNEDK